MKMMNNRGNSSSNSVTELAPLAINSLRFARSSGINLYGVRAFGDVTVLLGRGSILKTCWPYQ